MGLKSRNIFRFWGLLSSGVLLICILFVIRYPTDRDTLKVLYHAGPNAPELLRTLDHFRRDPDTGKYEAAKFLIRNMDLYYFKTDPFSDQKVDWASKHPECNEEQLESGDDSLELVWQEMKLSSRVEKIRDGRHVSSDFLILHINQAFYLWENSPWSDHFTFDQFCEYFLPYKTNMGRPAFWIEEYKNKYEFVLDSSGMVPSPAETAYRVWDTIQSHFRGYYLKLRRHLSADEMDNTLTGDCLILADWLGYIFKSVGLPVANIYTPKWANAGANHHWNAWMDSDGNWREIMSRGETVKNWEYVAPKIFARTGGKQKLSFRALAEEAGLDLSDIPPRLRPWNVLDITSDIIPTADKEVRLTGNAPPGAKFVYLAVYDQREWIPVNWAVVSGKTAVFREMGMSALYMPAYFHDQRAIQAGTPFILNQNGTLQKIESDSIEYHVTVDRVYPLRYHVLNRYRKKMDLSSFEASNHSDFSAFHTLHTIDPDTEASPVYIPEMRGRWQYEMWWQEVTVHNSQAYRYIRYRSDSNTICEIGEVELLNPSGEPIPVVRAFGPGENPEFVCDGVSGEPYQSKVPGSWVAMDLGKPKIVSRLRFIPKDVSPASIQKGDIYKLSGWDKGDWANISTDTATKKSISYRLYGGKMYLLENLSRTVESRPFIYDPGEKAIHWY